MAGRVTGKQIRDDSVTGDDVDENTLIITHLEDLDNDTKVQVEKSSDEDKIRFDTNGVERMIITDTGKVGIGNNITPGYKLDVDGDVKIRGNDIRDSSGSKTISFDGSANVIIPNELEVGTQASVTGSIFMRNTFTTSGNLTAAANIFLQNHSGNVDVATAIRNQFVNDADSRFSSGWTIGAVVSGGGGQEFTITSTNLGSQFDFSSFNSVNGSSGAAEIIVQASNSNGSSTFSSLMIRVMGQWNTIPNGSTLVFQVDADGSGGNQSFKITFQDVTQSGSDTNGFSSSSSITYGDTNYINFDHSSNTTFVEGQNGFGFRGYQGQMQVKDLGGSWSAISSVAAAGDNRSVQFNDNGALGGSLFYYGSNDKVGVGDFSSVSPDALLDVQGNLGGSGNPGIMKLSDRGSKNPIFIFQRSRGSLGSETAVQNGDSLATMDFKAFNGSTYDITSRIISTFSSDLSGGTATIEFHGKATTDSATRKIAQFEGNNTLAFNNGANTIESNNENGVINLNQKLRFSINGTEVGAVFNNGSQSGIQADGLYSKGVIGFANVFGQNPLQFTTTDARTNCLSFSSTHFAPHLDRVTSNIGTLSLGSSTQAWNSLYSEEIRGPSGVDIKVKADNNDVIMHIGTQGSYANNVGIGTTTPEWPLVVKGSSSTDPDAQIRNATTSGPILALTRENTLVTDIDSGQTLGTLTFGTSVGTLQACNIKGKALSNWDGFPNTSRLSQLTFETSTVSEGTPVVYENMTIDVGKVHCKQDFEVDGDADVGNNLNVNLTATVGSSLRVGTTLNTNKWYSNSLASGVSNTWHLLDYSESAISLNPRLTVNEGTNDLVFQYKDTNGRETFRCEPDGKTLIGTFDGAPQYSAYDVSLTNGGLYVEGFNNDGPALKVVNRSVDDNSDGISIIVGYGSYQRQNASSPLRFTTATNSWVKFLEKKRSYVLGGSEDPDTDPPDDTRVASAITGNGSGGVTYNTSFTGAHCCVIKGTAPIEIGMIVKSTGELWLKNVENISTSLPYVQKCVHKNDKTVFGVVSNLNSIQEGYKEHGQISEDDTYLEANGLGEGCVWVTNFEGEPTNGDYITTSPIDGYGQLQADDILHSYTVAKLIEHIDWSNVSDTVSHEGVMYTRYLAGCTYHCG